MNTASFPSATQTHCDKPSFFEELVAHHTATHVIVVVNDRPYQYAVRDFIHNFLPRYDDYLVHVRNNSIKVNGWTLVENRTA
jgi:hypothetical protein